MLASGGDATRVRPQLISEHERWRGLLARSWRRLDDPERQAWAALGHIDGQILHRETFYKSKNDKEGEQFAVLDGDFADTVCREWLGVEPDDMPRVWAGVLLLHDLKWQGGRDHESVCWHHDRPLALLDPTRTDAGRLRCHRCSKRFRCRVCWKDGVWHSHGG